MISKFLQISGLVLGISAPIVSTGQQVLLSDAPPTDHVTALTGFKVERIYTTRKAEGSWVAMAVDDKGRLITADQYGGLFRVTVPVLTERAVTQVEPLDTLGIGGAQGLLYANHSLYVMVNQVAANKFAAGKAGLYRLRDTDDDDRFDHAEFLREMSGTGEHGTHALTLGPDGKTIYYSNGNYTALPQNLEKHIPVAWSEDLIVPRMWSPVGTGRGILAPGGYIGRTDLESSEHELVALGLRNAYRLAFDPNGEFFTYDSDSENDNGSPFYMPTRITHVVSGGEYGWRAGSGRWPAYYADSLPAVLNMGPGSPTAVLMGTGARFPAKYQNALFGADWTFGTLYAIHLIPEGASFRATKEEFVSGRPLPLTDLVINPKDGAMYFTAGGRLTDSALYRIQYIGPESTAPATYPALTPAALVRRKLESLYHVTGRDLVPEIWPYLSNDDRMIRWAARVVLERQPATGWAEKALAETNLQARIEALVALARIGEKSLQPRLIDALLHYDLPSLPVVQQLRIVRLWELAFTRMGEPPPEVKRKVAAHLDRFFPTSNPAFGRELAGLLVFLDSPNVVAKTIPLLQATALSMDDGQVDETLLARNDRYGKAISGINATRPDRQQFAYVFALRSARAGWTPQLREAYFSWFRKAYTWTGGLSFAGYLDNIRQIALAGVPNGTHRDRLAQISLRPPPKYLAETKTPQGPGSDYTVESATKLVRGQLEHRNFEQGRAMYIASSCAICHRLGALSQGTVGPNLTQAGSRYTERDLLESIIKPSATINEAAAATRYEMADGSVLIGYPAFEEKDELFILANPMSPGDLTMVKTASIQSSRPSEVSLMPPGLVNSLNPDELRDLVAFVLSGGNARNSMFGSSGAKVNAAP